MSSPDEVMLRKDGEDARSRPLTPEEQAAFAADGTRIPVPSVYPYMKFKAPDERPGVELGLKGTF